jgi:Protein of unknown function (DUF3987)
MPDESPGPELEISPKWVGRSGTVDLTARVDGVSVHADRIEIVRAADREKFADDLCRERPGFDRASVLNELLKIHAGFGAKGAYGAAPAADPDESPIAVRAWPSPPAAVAFHGPTGRLARSVAPYTEADTVGVLVQSLVAFGNLAGRNAFFQVNSTRHYANMFCCTVGPTGAGRKGTGFDIVRSMLSHVDQGWADARITGGLSSGEGLIWAVRDPVEVQETVREKGGPAKVETVLKDAGESDKRLLPFESELGGLLKVVTREGNTLSALIRQSWDSGCLRSLSKNNPGRATDAHISIVGHVTEFEVSKYLTENESANGFANRFLWTAVRMSKFLPDGAAIPADVVRPIIAEFTEAATFAKDPRRIDRDPAARELWHEVYPDLCRGRPGLLGAMLGRAPAQVMRLALIHALLDRSGSIRREHLEAALALWEYSERSAVYIFGASHGDKDTDTLIEALKSNPSGLTRSQIRSDVFGRHKSSGQIGRILGTMLEANLVESSEVETGGRSATIWRLKQGTGGAPKAPYAPKAPPYGAYGAFGASGGGPDTSSDSSGEGAPKAPYAPKAPEAPEGGSERPSDPYGANGAYGAPPPDQDDDRERWVL